VTTPTTAPVGAVEAFDPADAYPLALQLRLVDLGLAEVVVVDGIPSVAVDPIFEAARTAALAGFDDAEQARRARILVGAGS